MMQKTTILFLILILTACGTNAEDANSEATELTDVNFQMNWVHEYSVSPIHAAVQEGFFENEGLNVVLNAGGFDEDGNYIDPFAPVINGEAMFGLASDRQILQARSDGTPLVAIMALLQNSPSTLLSLEETGIESPQDLVGKTIMASEDSSDVLQFFLAGQSIDTSTVEIIPRTSFGIEPLLNGEADVLLSWIINEGVQVSESGNSPSYLTLSEYGINTYDVVVFTTEENVNDNPDIIQSFIKAVSDGITFSIDNPQQSIEHTLSFAPDLDSDAQLRRLEAMIPLLTMPDEATGNMTASTWLLSYGLLLDNDMIDELAFDDAYTTQFIIQN